MNRNQKPVYCFIYDENKHFYRGKQIHDGSWIISSNSELYPLSHSPKNLRDSPVEFATNKAYFSMNRSINYPLEFDFDGAAILNYKYTAGKGANELLFFAIFEFDPNGGKYKLSYNGRFDFQQKNRDEKLGTFSISLVDDSAWGVLSQNDDVTFALDCSENNPKAIKVLIDDFTLKNRYTFQTVNAPIVQQPLEYTFTVPFVLVNQDGDSAGVISKSQILDYTINQPLFVPFVPGEYTDTSSNYFFNTLYPIQNANFRGTFSFIWNSGSTNTGIYIAFRTSKGKTKIIFTNDATYFIPPDFLVNIPDDRHTRINLVTGQIYTVDFSFNIDLDVSEKVFLFAFFGDITVNPITTNIFITTSTKAEPAICYALRPLDAIQDLVKKGTLERYSIGSEFFTDNNKTVLIPGTSIRGIRYAKIYTSFKDFFDSFSALFFMALRVVNGSLFMELADEVYKQDSNIIDLGEIIECKTAPAIEYLYNELEVGSPKQDYRHPSGRLEFNAPMTFSFPSFNVKNKLSLKSVFRTDCYGIIFLLLDYRGESTQDNSGDTDVFIVDITDEQGAAVEDIETFENINVDNAVLAPIIKYPLTGDTINNDKPFLKGIGIPGTNVNIYIASVLDGGTVVDSDGNWSYQITTSLPSFDPGVFDGISVINATNTDMSGALNTIQLIIDTTVSAATLITYPSINDNLYNNLPLIRGIAPFGTNIDIFLDGVLLASVVADNSCKFEFKVITPLSNGSHTLDIGTGIITTLNVDSFVDFPLITYIESELDGFPIINNLPLINGVAKPGTVVSIWLNYITYQQLANVIADVNGNWSLQVTPINYIDPLSGLPVILAPIRNGLSVISTELVNQSVKINVSGFKLNRPLYDSITGVPDNTVFNTRLSNKRALMNHKSLLASIMNKQKNDFIIFRTSDKNPTLRTVLGTEVVQENADISPAQLGEPLMLLEKANIKVIAKKTFSETLYDFNNGGTIKGTFKGHEIFMLPIGSMKMKNILDDVQEWSLLISPLTSYYTLLNLYKNGLTINLMKNALYHSDYNSLHMVTYNFQQPDKYNFQSIYDNWFDNRNDAWLYGDTKYIQKFQLSDGNLIDQVITNGITSMTLRMYRCKDATLVDVFNYNPIAPPPIPIPEVVLEVIIPIQNYPEDQYFFVMMVGDLMVAISERIETRTKWKKTILIESTNSANMPGIFFTQNFITKIRVEGLVKKIQPYLDTVIAREESGNTKTVYSNVAKKRMIRLGTAKGFPDYLGIKLACSVTNDNCLIEGTAYTLEDGEKMNPSEDIDGVPTYHYDVNMTLTENSRGKVFPGGDGADITGVIIVVDASAIGLPTDVLINIGEG